MHFQLLFFFFFIKKSNHHQQFKLELSNEFRHLKVRHTAEWNLRRQWRRGPCFSCRSLLEHTFLNTHRYGLLVTQTRASNQGGIKLFLKHVSLYKIKKSNKLHNNTHPLASKEFFKKLLTVSIWRQLCIYYTFTCRTRLVLPPFRLLFFNMKRKSETSRRAMREISGEVGGAGMFN